QPCGLTASTRLVCSTARSTPGVSWPMSPSSSSPLSSHATLSCSTISAAIRAAGPRLVFLPPYSPDLNPIEQVFAKLKHLMRKAAERTVEATWKRSGQILQQFMPDECSRYLQNAGYASS